MLRANRIRETAAQRENRLARNRRNRAARIANETPAQREARLAGDRRYRAARIANEAPAQREARLARRRANRNQPIPQQNPLHLAAVLDDQDKLRFGVPEENYLGPMDVVCRNWSAAFS